MGGWWCAARCLNFENRGAEKKYWCNLPFFGGKAGAKTIKIGVWAWCSFTLFGVEKVEMKSSIYSFT